MIKNLLVEVDAAVAASLPDGLPRDGYAVTCRPCANTLSMQDQ
jgi:hypothetical protein